MNAHPRYAKIVAWSDEDQCYIGTCPGLLYGGCHGDDERQVFDELCQIVDEVIALYHADDKPLPLPALGRDAS
jgi:predicted RNase H-like HicB family nuclease